MDKITPEQLDDKRTGDRPPFVLDVRPRDDFDRDRIDGSHNVPVYRNLQRGDAEPLYRELDDVPSDRRIVVVCKAGIVARRATAVLNEEGYDAATLLGGMRGWNGYRNDTLGYRLRSLLWTVAT